MNKATTKDGGTDWVDKLRVRYVIAAVLVIASMAATEFTRELQRKSLDENYLQRTKMYEGINVAALARDAERARKPLDELLQKNEEKRELSEEDVKQFF